MRCSYKSKSKFNSDQVLNNGITFDDMRDDDHKTLSDYTNDIRKSYLK